MMVKILKIQQNENWLDWKWQQKNAIRDESALRAACGDLSPDILNQIQKNLAGRKMQITPYYMKLIQESNLPGGITQNPLWRQVVPFWSEEMDGGYDGKTENWELHHEMKTPMCQHKY